MAEFLEFEKSIDEVNQKIEELRRVNSEHDIDFSDEIKRLEKRSLKLTKSVFSSLDPWQITQVARHPLRPHTLDYVDRIFTDFQELHGDRRFSDDPAVVAGIGRLNGKGVAIIGHQKGRDTTARQKRNFGMPKPEGYRKAQRIVKLAERFSLPILTFIDTPGAYPGVDAEKRGQSEAIASILYTLVETKTPILASVIGEGGSGGALAIGIADYVFMMQFSVYSVISPEGCASILWKDASRAKDAANEMGITSDSLADAGLIDEVIREPLGGAHRDYDLVAKKLKNRLEYRLSKLASIPVDELVVKRYERLMSYGVYKPVS